MRNIEFTTKYKQLEYIIGSLVKPLREKELLGFLNEGEEEVTEENIEYISGVFNLTSTKIENKNIKHIDYLVLPGICKFKEEDYILQNKTKEVIVLFDINDLTEKVIPKKEWKYITNVILFLKDTSKDVLNSNNNWFFEIFFKELKTINKVIYITIFLTLFIFVSPLYIMSVYDRVIPTNGIETLYVLTGGAIIIYYFNYWFQKIKNNIVIRLNTNISKRLDKIVIDKIIKVSPQYDLNKLSYKLMVFKDIQAIKEFYITNVTSIVLELPIFIGGLLLIAFLSPSLTLIPISITIVMLLLNFKRQKELDLQYQRIYEENIDKQELILDIINSKKDIVSNNASNHIMYYFNNLTKTQEIITENIRKIQTNYGFELQNLLHLTTILFVFFGTMEIIDLEMSVGYLIALIVLSNRMMTPIISLNQNLLKYFEVKKSFESVNSFFKLPEMEVGDKIISINKKPEIDINNVSYKYGKEYIFENISLKINPNDFLVIIGSIGAGKSTLFKLLIGELTPSNGSVRINGYEIKEVNQPDLQTKINLLRDDSSLFKGRFYDNVDIRSKYNMDKLMEIIENKKLSFLINGKKEILSKDIRNRGENLSEGERQIIFLLRTFIYDSDLIILDEPMKGLDPMMKLDFLQFLGNYSKNKTVIVFTNEPDLYLSNKMNNRLLKIENKTLMEFQGVKK